MRCVTWGRDSHGLFDYESRQIAKRNIKSYTGGKIIRLNNDVEFISIYYLDNNPVKVYFSSHSTGQGEGHWVDYDKAEKRNGFLVIYIARNSHANYPTSGTHARIYGFANDETSSSGPNRTFTWQEMTPSYDWNNGHGIGISKGLREAPPDFSKSSTQRILYGL
jgi:hypothetical protein